MSAGERERFTQRPSAGSDAMGTARAILDDVRTRGEAAVRDYAQRFDQWAPAEGFRVPASELAAAANALPQEDADAILAAARAVRVFHEAQGYRPVSVETWPGARAERRATPIDVAGLYVPAGTAPLVSTLIMLAVPAKIAGVPRTAVIAPPRKGQGVDPAILAAAQLLGLDEVYAIGGAHGVAALGYGLAGLPKADKIFGPGNAYVAAAKALLAQSAGGAATDLPAGPSEVMVVADDDADPDFVAIDLLSQAEHDRLAQVMLVAWSDAFVDQVEASIARWLERLPRADTARAALAASRAIIVSKRGRGGGRRQRLCQRAPDCADAGTARARRKGPPRGIDLHRPLDARSRGRLCGRPQSCPADVGRGARLWRRVGGDVPENHHRPRA